MDIVYDTRKDLPCEALHALFYAVGWSDGNVTPDMMTNFNKGFLGSTFVFSAWDGERLVGCVRVLSDRMFRSVIYDLAVLPDYQRRGIGKTLVQKCREACPGSEWLVQTESAEAFYKKCGFSVKNDCFLTIPCKWFGT